MTPDVAHTRPHQLTLLTALYAAQGLPFGFFTLALPVLLREAGWSLTAISFLQFLALPWALKFLWAPVVDHHGSRRGWLLGLQAAACGAALLLSQMDLALGSVALFAAVFVFNLIAATQDIVTDGLAVRLLNAQERGVANAVQVGAYRLGMVLGGGLLLWVFARSSWSVMFLCMAAMLALTTVPVLLFREPRPAAHLHQGAAVASRDRPGPARADVPQGWRLAVAWAHRALSPSMLAMAALIFCFRFGDQMVSALIVPFVADQDVGKDTIALMKGAVGSGTSLLGAVLGGWVMLQAGRRTVLLASGLGQAACFGLYIAAALGWGGMGLLWTATVLEGVIGTVASVALFALMMDVADPRHAGTDYTVLASVVVAVGSLGGIAGGVAGDALGYAPAFAIGTALCVAGTLALVAWLDRWPAHPRVAQAWRHATPG